MTAFVFSLVLTCGVILFWAARKLLAGAEIAFGAARPVSTLAARGSRAATRDAHVAPRPSPAIAPSPPAARPSPAAAPAPSSIESAPSPISSAPSATAAEPSRGTTAPPPSATAAPSAAPAKPATTPGHAVASSEVVGVSGSSAAHGAASSNGATSPLASTAPAAAPSAAAAPAAAPGAPIVPPAPAGKAPDNLRRMIGIGPVNERHLNGLGITTFAQIAAWTPDEVKRVEAVLAFDGRIARERWVEQAGLLAAGDTAEFLKRFPQAGKGGNT